MSGSTTRLPNEPSMLLKLLLEQYNHGKCSPPEYNGLYIMHIADVYSVAIPPHSLLMVSKDHFFWPSIAYNTCRFIFRF